MGWAISASRTPSVCRAAILSGADVVVARYYRELLNFLARATSDPDTAADLAHESYARVLAAQRTGQEIRHPRGLLYRTARNLVIDAHRRDSVRVAVHPHAWDEDEQADEAACMAAPAAFDPEAVLASRQGLAAVLDTIDRLPPRCREVFILYKFDGLTYAQVAQHMGISVRTVEMQLQIAMKACWACLEEQECESDGVSGQRKGRST